jgi:uncharacterized protein (DUF58 family)
LLRWLRPPRLLRPTRAGWVFFVLTLGVGFAALNTGNNLLYLVLSLMLAFLVLSGVLSESALRGVSVRRRLPKELFAERPSGVSLEISNAQRRVPAFAVAVEDRVREADGAERAAGRAFVLRIAPRATETRLYRFEAKRRGPATFTAFRVSTRFPFGLFLKSLVVECVDEVLVYPAFERVPPPAPGAGRAEPGESIAEGAGAGSEVGGVRAFQQGDPVRRIQWRATLRRGELIVRDTEREHAREVEVRLRTRGERSGERFEGAVRAAASRVVAALDAGVRVALRTDETRLPAAAGVRQRARLLGHLARVEPEEPAGAGPRAQPGRASGSPPTESEAERSPGGVP